MQLHLKTFFTGALFFIYSQVLFSQITQVPSIHTTNSITLRSDGKPKSALLSNISTNVVGDQSPFLVVAAWQDSGKQFECRSMIEFDLKDLPNFIKQMPDKVESAELILYPKPAEEKNTQPYTFYINRVWEPWTDSLTTWDKKPIVNAADKVKVKIDPARKKAVRIDVTKMVINMIKFGNYGFMFTRQDSIISPDKGDWFASPKNNEKRARPVLVINYSNIYYSTPGLNDYRTPRPRQTQQDQRGNTNVPPRPRTGGN